MAIEIMLKMALLLPKATQLVILIVLSYVLFQAMRRRHIWVTKYKPIFRKPNCICKKELNKFMDPCSLSG